MANHTVDCPKCGEDLRGLSGGHASDCPSKRSEQPPLQAALVAMLEKCAKRFREYETNHREKQTIYGDAKARRNAEMAEECEALISRCKNV